MTTYSVIVTHDLDRGIGKDGSIPWDLPGNRQFFEDTTTGHAVVMGKNTWLSIGQMVLPDRINIVMSQTLDNSHQQDPDYVLSQEQVHVAQTFDELDKVVYDNNIQNVFFIGGAALFEYILTRYIISKYYITEYFRVGECDVFLPIIALTSYSSETVATTPEYRIRVYTRQPLTEQESEEFGYLTLLRNVLDHGTPAVVRDHGTIERTANSVLTFNLRTGFPLITTKRVCFRLIAEELLFFISGKTDNAILQEKNVNIWNGHSTIAYLKTIGHGDWEEGDLGKFYGFQWRHWGAEYCGKHTDYDRKGFDQLSRMIEGIKENPYQRRHLLSAWNPEDVDDAALPPCHVLYQFHVSQGELSCSMYQRSGDLFLGVPFNIASTALLTHLIAGVCGLGVGDITIYFGNAHIYLNHIDQVNEQLTRSPYPFPTITITPRESIDDYTIDDIVLNNYIHHPTIRGEMAI